MVSTKFCKLLICDHWSINKLVMVHGVLTYCVVWYFFFIFFVYCLYLSCVLYTRCCQFLWIVYAWLPVRFSLTFITRASGKGIEWKLYYYVCPSVIKWVDGVSDCCLTPTQKFFAIRDSISEIRDLKFNI